MMDDAIQIGNSEIKSQSDVDKENPVKVLKKENIDFGDEVKEQNIKNKILENKVNDRIKISRYLSIYKYIFGGILIISIVLLLIYKIHFNFENEYIDSFKISEFYQNLSNFVPRFNETSKYTNERITKKSTIRFVLRKFIFQDCYNIKDVCKFDFVQEKELINKNSLYKFNDVYYNFIIYSKKDKKTKRGELHEGRPLNFPFNETFLDETHSSIITVGISYCFPGETTVNYNHTTMEIKIIKNLVRNLKEKGILTDNYILEFPDVCNNSLLLQSFTPDLGQFFFYKQESLNLFNVSTVLNPTILRNFLFLKDKVIDSDQIYENISHPINLLPQENNSCENSNFFITLKIITIRFIFSYVSNKNDFDVSICTSNYTFNNYCWPYLKYLIMDTPLYNSIGNYFIIESLQTIYKETPFNCSNDIPLIQSNDSVVNIVIFYSEGLIKSWMNSEESIVSFSKSFNSIINDIGTNFVYSKVDIQFVCDLINFPLYYFLHFYESFVDFSFASYSNNHYIINDKCKI